jgi:DNA-binding response OmpR family regulator
MKVLIADDDAQVLRVLELSLKKVGYTILKARDGNEAWEAFQEKDAPCLAILDWMMPGLDGITLCKKVREHFPDRPLYLLLLTGKDKKENIVEGLQAGADDFISKPFHIEELIARLQVGARVIELQMALEKRVKELEEALARVKTLEGLLPICCYCKRIHDEQGEWQPIDVYVTERSEAKFTHVVCPECKETILIPEMEAFRKRSKE